MNARPTSRIRSPRALVSLLALTLALAGAGALVPSRAGAGAFYPAKCLRVLSRYRHPDMPKNVVEVLGRRGLSCAHAERVAVSLNRAVQHNRLPFNAYAPHAGAPGYPHPGHSFT